MCYGFWSNQGIIPYNEQVFGTTFLHFYGAPRNRFVVLAEQAGAFEGAVVIRHLRAPVSSQWSHSEVTTMKDKPPCWHRCLSHGCLSGIDRHVSLSGTDGGP
jgi:hypothetical protein